MGSVESLVPISPNEFDFEGFSENDNLCIQDGSISDSGNTNQTMVYGAQTETIAVHTYRDEASTSGNRQTGGNEPNYQTPRLEVLGEGFQRQFPHVRKEGIVLMTKPHKTNSLKDYQCKWNTFVNYIKDNKISFCNINISHVLNFFIFLFYDKHLKPNTVAHYISALSHPLEEYFKISLQVKAVTDLLRGMRLQRPSSPVSHPSWNLIKVLTFIENLEEPMSELMLLRKTAFLLKFSTCYRISELHACVRDEEVCYVTKESTLKIRPHPSFLAKNKCPQK